MHTWKVLGLKVFPSLDGKANVVYSAHWSYGPLDAIVEFNKPSDQFIPFDQLTEDVVLGWVWAKTPKEAWEERVRKVEDAANNPKPEAVTVKLPWA